MTKIIKVYEDDFERVYELLKWFTPNNTKNYWKPLFTNYWERPEDYHGFAIEEGDKIVGFLGTIFSYRYLNGTYHKYCNLSTWVVREEHRNKSISLLMQILKLKDYTITIFSANPAAKEIFQNIGFTRILNNVNILIPTLGILMFKKNYKIFLNEKVKQFLSEEELKIYHDHQQLEAHHVFINTPMGNSYFIIRRKYIKKYGFKIPVGVIKYLSNKMIFLQNKRNILSELRKKCHMISLINSDIFVKDNIFKYNMEIQEIFIKSNIINKDNIDFLYSENILLDY